MKWLIETGGIEAVRLEAKGFGPDHPLADNATPGSAVPQYRAEDPARQATAGAARCTAIAAVKLPTSRSAETLQRQRHDSNPWFHLERRLNNVRYLLPSAAQLRLD